MKILFIGGTGLISSACTELAAARGVDVYLLNRAVSHQYSVPAGAQLITADIRGEENVLERLLQPYHFDAVVDWVAFTPDHIERDIRLFTGKTNQFVFISSASVYEKPPSYYIITERTRLHNPFWQYSIDKIACEERLMKEYHQHGFPVTIIRPSLTYGPSQIPLHVNSWQHPYTLIDRMKRGKKIIIPGDGTSLWTMTWNGDFAVGLLGLLGLQDAVGEDFHITSDEVLCWNQLYAETGKALGLKPSFVHIASDLIAAYDFDAVGSLIGDKINSAVFDNSKIRRFVPEFDPKVTWAEGIRRSIAWHEADLKRQTIDQAAGDLWDKILAAYERALP
jgi:nucleoside-diphosphate-sugar epimerase